MRRIMSAVLAVSLLAAATALAVPVTFQVRMAYQVELGVFDPAVDSVDLAGTFNGWGDPLIPLADADADTTYSVTVDGFAAGQAIEFKFRINGQWDGSEEFPGGGPNRQYTVQPSDNEILVWYGDQVSHELELGELAWWNDTVFYELFVRSFHDSDGDGIGDFQGLIQKLDYLNDGDPATDTDLGVTGLWLMPINDSPSYHGYDVTDYRGVNPDYGTLADFEEFLAAAHARGIKVIIDDVMNHCSSQHPWFTAAAAGNPATRDWFRWSAGNPGQTGPWGQVVWHWHPSGYYYGLFGDGMPDLNYETPAVKAEMFDTAAWWLDTVGVDGFRLDAVLYIFEDGDQLQNTPATFQFWHDFNAHIKAVAPDALSVGEAWTNTGTVLQYVSDDRLDLCFEFELAGATLGAVNAGDAGYLAAKARSVHDVYPYLQFATFLTNHDQDRVFTVLGEDEGKNRVAAGIYLTLPGVPFLYYGEEIGMVGSGAHEFIRSPMQWDGGPGAGFTTGVPWQPLNGNYPQYNVADEQQDPGSLWRWYRQLIDVRRATPALRRGEFLALESSAGAVLAFLRRDAGRTVLCVANTGAAAQPSLALTGSADALTPGEHGLINLLDPDDTPLVSVSSAFALTGLSLAGYEVAVYRFTSATGVQPDGSPLPGARIRLEQNVPNPFNPATRIRYALSDAGNARLAVFDLAGRQVAVLWDGVQAAGTHTARWDGRDHAGRSVGAGVYLARLEAGGETTSMKLVLAR
ncbi:MAG: alpha-amylase family glycosyl hydrolase [Candidatus Krumholzibacteriia bacterium]